MTDEEFRFLVYGVMIACVALLVFSVIVVKKTDWKFSNARREESSAKANDKYAGGVEDSENNVVKTHPRKRCDIGLDYFKKGDIEMALSFLTVC